MSDMVCENKFCVYWSDNRCVLKEIVLDIQGSCTSCVYITMDDEELDNLRREQLEKE